MFIWLYSALIWLCFNDKNPHCFTFNLTQSAIHGHINYCLCFEQVVEPTEMSLQIQNGDHMRSDTVSQSERGMSFVPHVGLGALWLDGMANQFGGILLVNTRPSLRRRVLVSVLSLCVVRSGGGAEYTQQQATGTFLQRPKCSSFPPKIHFWTTRGVGLNTGFNWRFVCSCLRSTTRRNLRVFSSYVRPLVRTDRDALRQQRVFKGLSKEEREEEEVRLLREKTDYERFQRRLQV